jgi:hypothetical protein
VSESSSIVMHTVLYSLLPLACIAIVVIFVFWIWNRRKLHLRQLQIQDPLPVADICPVPLGFGSLHLLEIKAHGRFGCVWKARTCSGSVVAVKVHTQIGSTVVYSYHTSVQK